MIHSSRMGTAFLFNLTDQELTRLIANADLTMRQHPGGGQIMDEADRQYQILTQERDRRRANASQNPKA